MVRKASSTDTVFARLADSHMMTKGSAAGLLRGGSCFFTRTHKSACNLLCKASCSRERCPVQPPGGQAVNKFFASVQGTGSETSSASPCSYAAPLYDNDLAICAQLALEAGDWVIHRLELAGIDDDPSEFRIARKISYDAEHLQEEARQQKENDLAMWAFRLMERLKSGPKRQRRPRGPQPSTKKARQTAMPCDEQGELSPSRLSEESWSEDSEWAGSAGEEDQDPWMPLDLNLGGET